MCFFVFFFLRKIAKKKITKKQKKKHANTNKTDEGVITHMKYSDCQSNDVDCEGTETGGLLWITFSLIGCIFTCLSFFAYFLSLAYFLKCYLCVCVCVCVCFCGFLLFLCDFLLPQLCVLIICASVGNTMAWYCVVNMGK